MSTKLCLIDGSSLLYRSYYGVRPLHTSKGMATHAIYGMCRTLKKLIDELKPTHIILVWDSKGPTMRHEEFSEYKATRQAPPSDLLTQKKAIQEFADKIGLRQCAESGFEADDILFTAAQKHLADEITVVTGDKDLHQMLSDTVSIYDPFKQKTITKDSFTIERGFEPQHLMLYHSLLGDSSDNIPGVKGVGKKTAETLTQKYKTIDNLYAHLDELKPRTIKLLTESKENAYLSKQLFTLRESPLSCTLEESFFDKNQWRRAVDFFHEYEITPFYPKDVKPVAASIGSSDGQLSLFAQMEQKTPRVAPAKWEPRCVTTKKELLSLLERIQSLEGTDQLLAVDTETNGLKPYQDAVVGISCAFEKHEAFYIPFGHTTDEKQLSQDEVLSLFKPVLENKKIKKTLHNTKFDQLGFAQYNITLRGVAFDSLIAAFLLRKSNEKIGLKAASIRYLSEEMISFSQLEKEYKLFRNVPLELATQYAAHDARQTLFLSLILKEEIEKDAVLSNLLYSVELPLSTILCNMEQVGISLDTAALEKLKGDVSQELTGIISKLESCLEGAEEPIDFHAINLNSPKQLEVLLFDVLKLPVIKKSPKTGKRSTNSEVLHELEKIHPVPGLIIRYRELAKLLSTYIEALPHEINPRTEKIHTSFSQTITATGRLSSSQPNLQNIPVGSGFGSKVRGAFIPPRGHVFLSADYSQVELRILAHYSQDPALLKAFAHDADIHRQTAAQIFDVPENEVTHDQRQIGKKINFSIIYGLTPYGLSKDLGISPSVAREYIDSYFATYAGVKTWMDGVIEAAIESGFVETHLGRRRYVPGLRERNRTLFEAEKRIAINTPIQGTAADLIKVAMIHIDKKLSDNGLMARQVLQIHDELLLQVPESEIEAVSTIVQESMQNVVQWDIPLNVELRTGSSWEEAGK